MTDDDSHEPSQQHEKNELTDLERRLDGLWTNSSPVDDTNVTSSGRVVSHYQICDLLGRGAFGIVYRSKDLNSGKQVALKLPRPEVLVDPEKRNRFTSEAIAAAKLNHPGIVEVLEADLEGPTPLIAAAFCNGPNLAEWMDSNPQLPPWKDAVLLMAKIADAVHYAHSQGVFHRDLKPANIMLVTSDQELIDTNDLNLLEPKLTDFGLAKLSDPTLTDTRSSLLIGTPSYMAPEQLDPQRQRTEAFVATDVYSLGVILFELLTGQLPTSGETYFQVLDNLRTSPPKNLRRVRSNVPRSLGKISTACLQKNPQARYASAADLANDLRRCAEGRTATGRQTSLLSKIVYWCSHPQRMKTAGSFTLGCQALSIFWLSLAGIGIGAFNIVNRADYFEILTQVTMLVFVFMIPMCWTGLMTLRGFRWGAWLAMTLTLLNLPLAMVPLLHKPMIFQPLYEGHHPYFSFAVHTMPAICFFVQAFLLGCALVATRPEKEAIPSN